MRYNHCPDEKGTESLWGWQTPHRAGPSYNHCPDEKGTESSDDKYHIAEIRWVTTIAPMKRGLKGDLRDAFNLVRCALQPLPR